MAEQALGGIARFEVADVPVGGVAVGLIASGLIDSLMGMLEGVAKQKLPVWLVKGAGAYVASKYLPKYLGEGAKYAAVILAVDAVQSVYDFRRLTSGLFAAPAATTATTAVLGKIGERRALSEVKLTGREVSSPNLILPPELLSGKGGMGTISQVAEQEEEVLVSVT